MMIVNGRTGFESRARFSGREILLGGWPGTTDLTRAAACSTVGPGAALAGSLVRFLGRGKRAVIDGAVHRGKELIAGYWVIQVHVPRRGIEWAKRPLRAPIQTRRRSRGRLRRLF